MEGTLSGAPQDKQCQLYLVDMHDTRKQERTFHVNMLKKWNTPTCGNYWADAGGEDWSEEDDPEWRGGGEGDPKIGEQVTTTQKSQLEELLKEFTEVMSSSLGRTTLMEHQVTTTGSRSIRLSPSSSMRIENWCRQGSTICWILETLNPRQVNEHLQSCCLTRKTVLYDSVLTTGS